MRILAGALLGYLAGSMYCGLVYQRNAANVRASNAGGSPVFAPLPFQGSVCGSLMGSGSLLGNLAPAIAGALIGAAVK